MVSFDYWIYLGIYIYLTVVHYGIAKRLFHQKPWLAFIPFSNLFLLSQLAKKDWRKSLLIYISFLIYLVASISMYFREKIPGEDFGFIPYYLREVSALGLFLISVAYVVIDFYVEILRELNYSSKLSYVILLTYYGIFFSLISFSTLTLKFNPMSLYVSLPGFIVLGLVAWKSK